MSINNVQPIVFNLVINLIKLYQKYNLPASRVNNL